MPAAVELAGELDAATLAAALAGVAARHEVLRAAFPAPEGQPVQVVVRDVRLEPRLPLVDLSAGVG
jgi:hypothetical protein